MDARLVLAYGALLIVAVLVVGLVWFARRKKRAYYREHVRSRRIRNKQRGS